MVQVEGNKVQLRVKFQAGESHRVRCEGCKYEKEHSWHWGGQAACLPDAALSRSYVQSFLALRGPSILCMSFEDMQEVQSPGGIKRHQSGK